MKVTIIKSFVVPPAAPFTPGEILTVNDELAAEWIRLGNAVEGLIPAYKNPATNLIVKKPVKGKWSKQRRKEERAQSAA
jgi:hypothetical protein